MKGCILYLSWFRGRKGWLFGLRIEAETPQRRFGSEDLPARRQAGSGKPGPCRFGLGNPIIELDFLSKIFVEQVNNVTFAVRFQICFHIDDYGSSLKPCFASACEGAVYGRAGKNKNMV